MKIRGNTVGTPLSIEKIKEEISTLLVVELISLSGLMTASHSATEILRYLGNGGYVIGMDDNGMLVTLAGYNLDSELAIFTTPTDANGAWKEYTIDDNKIVTVKEMSFATKAEIGNIETALDRILAIQNKLIGGEEE